MIAYGLVRAVALGLLERLPERDLLRDDDDEGERRIDYDLAPGRLRFGLRRRRKSGGQRPGDL